MRAAIYLRVSTTDQSTSQQERELRAAAARMGHEVVEVYEDFGISGGKGREKRPAFDRLHNDATRRGFDIVMAWSVDRLGRSLQDLVAFLEHIRAGDIGLFLHQQGLDTTTPSGRAMFQMLGVFSEFERSIIRERVKSGMARAKATGTKSGKAIGVAHALIRRGERQSALPIGLAVSGCAALRDNMASPLKLCGASWPDNPHRGQRLAVRTGISVPTFC